MQGWRVSYFDNQTNFPKNYDRTYYWPLPSSDTMAGQELRRSYTELEILPRDRQLGLRPILFQQTHQSQGRDHSRRRFSAMPTNKVKHATMELYRPPNVRADGTSGSPPRGNCINNNAGGKLNVHAKEFTMNHRELAASRSNNNILAAMFGGGGSNNNGLMHPTTNGKGYALQQSKSSGNVLHSFHVVNNTSGNHGLSHRVHFRVDPLAAENQPASLTSPVLSTKLSPPRLGPGLKRSKSLSATDALRMSATTVAPSSNNNKTDLSVFPTEMHQTINMALNDPNELPARMLMALVKQIMERATVTRRYAEPAAKLCINIIEKEKKETFLESLLNTCQLWYNERDKYLKAKYLPFVAFLNEMYCQLKRSHLQLKTHYDGVPPPLLLLTLLSKCCQDCLKAPAVQSATETECLFFVLSSIGRDLEQELPKELKQVLAGVRDAFLTAVTTPAIRKTLLQLIELHASKWQLSAAAVRYYYPGTSR